MGTDVKINMGENTAAPAFLPETGKDNGLTLPDLRLNCSKLLQQRYELQVEDTEKSIPDIHGKGHLSSVTGKATACLLLHLTHSEPSSLLGCQPEKELRKVIILGMLSC